MIVTAIVKFEVQPISRFVSIDESQRRLIEDELWKSLREVIRSRIPQEPFQDPYIDYTDNNRILEVEGCKVRLYDITMDNVTRESK